MTDKTFNDQSALREVLAKTVTPILADWGLEDQSNALLDVLVGVFREGYSAFALFEIAAAIDDALTEEALFGEDDAS
jgi:hypothetical protein